MKGWKEIIPKDLAEAIVDLIITEAECCGHDFRKYTVPPKCKTYLDTLQNHGKMWFIYYNDDTGTTKTASITME